jgi:hypothetical protein
MAVTVNATGTVLDQAAATSAAFTGLTVAAGTNTVMVVVLIFLSNPGSGVLNSIVWDAAGANQTLTLIGKTQATPAGWNEWHFLYGLVAPATGNKTLSVAWTSSVAVRMNAIALDGADQTGGTTTFAHYTQGQGTSPATIAVTSAVGNLVVAGASVDGANLSAPTGTSIFNQGGGGWSAGMNRDAGAASVSIGWSASGNDIMIIGVDVVAAGSGGRTTKNTRAWPLGMALGMEIGVPGIDSAPPRIEAPLGMRRRDSGV